MQNNMNNQQNQEKALDRFARNLVEDAKKGKLDPVIGRDEEIRRVLQILSRRTKNNPVLIGEPGTGKTAIVGDWHTAYFVVMCQRTSKANRYTRSIWVH